jgi:SOS-response transcriptional repressor LexA
MDFWDSVRAEIKAQNTKIEAVAQVAGISLNTFNGWISKGRLPRLDEALKISKALGTTVEYLVTGEKGRVALLSDCEPEDPNVCNVPILNQKVAAGPGQQILDSTQVVGTLPFLKRMLRGANPKDARALEVRGDSMTGVEIFDGDLVVFVPGSIRGDGIYVLRVGDELIVKRVEFDTISKKLRIMSENARYPDRVESADGQAVEVVGKVYGWVHSHPY